MREKRANPNQIEFVIKFYLVEIFLGFYAFYAKFSTAEIHLFLVEIAGYDLGIRKSSFNMT